MQVLNYPRILDIRFRRLIRFHSHSFIHCFFQTMIISLIFSFSRLTCSSLLSPGPFLCFFFLLKSNTKHLFHFSAISLFPISISHASVSKRHSLTFTNLFLFCISKEVFTICFDVSCLPPLDFHFHFPYQCLDRPFLNSEVFPILRLTVFIGNIINLVPLIYYDLLSSLDSMSDQI